MMLNTISMQPLRTVTGAAAAVFALAANACVSDEGDLFAGVEPPSRDDPRMVPLAAQPEASPIAPAPPTSTVSSSEQMIAPARDLAPLPQAPAAASAPSEAAAEADGEPAAVEPSNPCEATDLLACDTFESTDVGKFPEGPGWLPELAGCGTHSIDDTGPVFSGTRSLRVADGGYPECMLHADVSGEADVYVQTRLFLGADATLLDQYMSLLEFGAAASTDDPELRVGIRPSLDNLCNGVPGLDITGSGLQGGPKTACSGVQLERERWYCVEAHLSRVDGDLSLSLSLDGQPLLDDSFTGAAAWAGTPLFVKVGRAAYGASSRGTLWYDDLVVSREPLPCGP
jgi:polysaccharide lyase-like protein